MKYARIEQQVEDMETYLADRRARSSHLATGGRRCDWRKSCTSEAIVARRAGGRTVHRCLDHLRIARR
jgi:hypothetical protein